MSCVAGANIRCSSCCHERAGGVRGMGNEFDMAMYVSCGRHKIFLHFTVPGVFVCGRRSVCRRCCVAALRNCGRIVVLGGRRHWSAVLAVSLGVFVPLSFPLCASFVRRFFQRFAFFSFRSKWQFFWYHFCGSRICQNWFLRVVMGCEISLQAVPVF